MTETPTSQPFKRNSDIPLRRRPDEITPPAAGTNEVGPTSKTTEELFEIPRRSMPPSEHDPEPMDIHEISNGLPDEDIDPKIATIIDDFLNEQTSHNS